MLYVCVCVCVCMANLLSPALDLELFCSIVGIYKAPRFSAMYIVNGLLDSRMFGQQGGEHVPIVARLGAEGWDGVP